MRRVVIASVVASAGLGGCFYVEPINQRPGIDIREGPADTVFRGDTLALEAIADDPEDHHIRFDWRVHLCDDAQVFASCDATPAITGTEDELVFEVPFTREDPAAPYHSLRVILDGRDDRGATAKPNDQLFVAVAERAPEVVMPLRAASAYEFVVGTPVDLFAKYTDADDPVDEIVVAWSASSPSNVPITLTDLDVAQDPTAPAYRTAGKRLDANAVGNWEIAFTATDPRGNTTPAALTVVVKPDRPPCIAAPQPIVPPVGELLDVTEPTLFRIDVDDDLDDWPLHPGDPLRQPPTFAWSIKPPGGARQPAGTGSSVAFDPATYVPDSVVEVRVEIADRNATALPCAEADPTCSVISNPTCVQRQTWKVRAR